MKIEEFNELTDKLEKFYDKELDEYEKSVWYDHLKYMPLKRYEQIVKVIFTENKFMPKLADVINYSRTIPYEETKSDIVECKKCNNKGFIMYKEIINGLTYDYVAKCNCKNAEKYKAFPSINEIGL